MTLNLAHTSFTVIEFFSPDVGGVVDDQELFRFFYMLICSGDTRDQSRKLSKIAKNFG